MYNFLTATMSTPSYSDMAPAVESMHMAPPFRSWLGACIRFAPGSPTATQAYTHHPTAAAPGSEPVRGARLRCVTR